MTAKEYLKQAYLLDKQIQVEVKELEQLRDMRGTIQGCSYGERIGSNPNRNLEAPFIKTIGNYSGHPLTENNIGVT